MFGIKSSKPKKKTVKVTEREREEWVYERLEFLEMVNYEDYNSNHSE